VSDVELAHRPGVELVNAGSWKLLSGSWNPNRTDILAAVEAAKCPAVRRPKLKLGHLDPRFNEPDDAQMDGTPSLGWFDNLRASADGNTLIGDQVALPWLSKVQAAAYPDRSVEGTHNARCALGHVHPFVITAVSLLGETPPGIPTLKSIKSIDDLPAALGVAASGQDTEGGNIVQATVRAAAPAPDGDSDEDDEPTGVMVALIPTADDAARLVVEGGEAAEDLHLTLAYLGDAAGMDPAAQQDLIDAVSSAVNGMPVVDGLIFSAAVYNPGDTLDRDTCLVYQVSGDLLDDLHDGLDDALGDPDFSPEPWFAHVTAIYTDDLARLSDLAANVGPISFDRVRIAIAGQTVDIPLVDYASMDAEDTSGYDMGADYGDPVMAAGVPGRGNPRALKSYWTKDPKGLALWASTPHPWTNLYHQLLKFIPDDEAKRTAAQWYHTVFKSWPGSKGGKVKAAAATVSDKPWNPQRGDYTPAQWKTACLIDTGTGDPSAKSRYVLPVKEPDGTINRAGVHAAASRLNQVDAPSAAKKAAAKQLVALYGDLGEKPPPALNLAASRKVTASGTDLHVEFNSTGVGDALIDALRKTIRAKYPPELPAAEPEPITTDPKEDLVSTDLSALRSRLGLDDTADLDAITSAVDALKSQAETPTPSPEMVAASAAAVEKAQQAEAEKDELRKEVQILASQMKSVSDELAATKAEKAATVKASVFTEAIKAGKIKPADREAWEKDYDEAPGAVTRVLASIAPGTAVPVAASGYAGPAEPEFDDDFDKLVARIDMPTGKAV
jgi:hypothetical protein